MGGGGGGGGGRWILDPVTFIKDRDHHVDTKKKI